MSNMREKVGDYVIGLKISEFGWTRSFPAGETRYVKNAENIRGEVQAVSGDNLKIGGIWYHVKFELGGLIVQSLIPMEDNP